MSTPATAYRYFVYGLSVASTINLPDLEPTDPSGVPDVVIEQGATQPAVTAVPEGQVLLDLVMRNSRWYCLVRREDGSHVCRVFGVADFLITSTLDGVTVAPFEGMKPGMERVMLTGTILSLLLQLRGECILHASAIERRGAALAFVGNSGRGKSTMATLMCREGAANVVTDDVLRVEQSADGRPLARRGVRGLRLRTTAEAIVATVEAEMGRRSSADDRAVVRPTWTSGELMPLLGIVIPTPNREGGGLTAERLPTAAAMMSLLAFPRVLGWRDPAFLARQFDQMAWIAKQVPVFAVQVPWGPPFAAELSEQLLAAIEWRGPTG